MPKKRTRTDEFKEDVRSLAEAFRAEGGTINRDQMGGTQRFEVYVRERRPDIDAYVRRVFRTYPYKVYDLWRV